MSHRTAISALLRADQRDACIDPTETVVFFPTAASLQPTNRWHIPIHGWIYQPTELSRLHNLAFRLIKRIVLVRYPKAELSTPLFTQRLAAFLADNERGNRVQIQLGHAVFTLRKSRPNGHFEGHI